MDVIIIDVEASGLHIDSYPVEMAVYVAGNVHSWLIRPEKNWQFWDRNAENLHGIKREFLVREGRLARHVADELNDVLSDTNGLLYSDAAEWDSDWIQTLFTTVGAIPQFHILPVQDLLSDTEYKRFQFKVDELANTELYRRHRAGEDVKLIATALVDILGSKSV